MNESYSVELVMAPEKEILHVIAKASCGDELHNQFLGIIKEDQFAWQSGLRSLPISYLGEITLKYAVWQENVEKEFNKVFGGGENVKNNKSSKTDNSEKIKRMPGVSK